MLYIRNILIEFAGVFTVIALFYSNNDAPLRAAVETQAYAVADQTVSSERFRMDSADSFEMGQGNDLVCAGKGKCTIDGGAGCDSLYGQTGNDTINGGMNNDKRVGGNSKDRLFVDEGNDRLLEDVLVKQPDSDDFVF